MAKRIMIVEDDLPTTLALTRLLEREGCEVRSYRDGEAALRQIEADPPDAISLDIKLSGALDGYAVMKKLKESARVPPPVVIVTNFGLPHEIERGKALGAADYLVKSDHSIHQVATKLIEVA